MLGRAEGESEEKETSGKGNGGYQMGTLVLADTDTGQSIGSSRRGYLLQKNIKGGIGEEVVFVLPRPRYRRC